MRSAIVLKRRNDVDFKKIMVDLEFTQPKKFEWILSPSRLPIPSHRLMHSLYHISEAMRYNCPICREQIEGLRTCKGIEIKI